MSPVLPVPSGPGAVLSGFGHGPPGQRWPVAGVGAHELRVGGVDVVEDVPRLKRAVGGAVQQRGETVTAGRRRDRLHGRGEGAGQRGRVRTGTRVRRAHGRHAGGGFGARESASVGGPRRRPAGRRVQGAALVGLSRGDGVGDGRGAGGARAVVVADDPVRGGAVVRRGSGALHRFGQSRKRRGGGGRRRGQGEGGGHEHEGQGCRPRRRARMRLRMNVPRFFSDFPGRRKIVCRAGKPLKGRHPGAEGADSFGAIRDRGEMVDTRSGDDRFALPSPGRRYAVTRPSYVRIVRQARVGAMTTGTASRHTRNGYPVLF